MQSLQLQNLELSSTKPPVKPEPISPARLGDFSTTEKAGKTGSFEDILSSLQMQKSEQPSPIQRPTTNESEKSETRPQNEVKTAEKDVAKKTEDCKKISDDDKAQVSKTKSEDSKKIEGEKQTEIARDEKTSENAAIENSMYFFGRIENANAQALEKIALDAESIGLDVGKIEVEGKNLLSEKNLPLLSKTERNAIEDFKVKIKNSANLSVNEKEEFLSLIENLDPEDVENLLQNIENLLGNTTDIPLTANLSVENLGLNDLEKLGLEIMNGGIGEADKKSSDASLESKIAKKITVRDYRTAKIDVENSNTIIKNSAKNTRGQLDFNLNQNETAKNQVTFELNARADATQNILASSNQAAGANGSAFESMLSQSIQTNAPDFVKAGTVVLKDEGKGSINLILHPESLGNVKVNLSLNDKSLSGVITVQSQEAFNAFKENLETLKNAFAQNGFENVDFNLSFANGNDASQQFAQNQNNENASKAQAKIAYSEYISLNPTEDFTENYITDGSFAVNLVA